MAAKSRTSAEPWRRAKVQNMFFESLSIAQLRKVLMFYREREKTPPTWAGLSCGGKSIPDTYHGCCGRQPLMVATLQHYPGQVDCHAEPKLNFGMRCHNPGVKDNDTRITRHQ
jgi:hypothetical protein